MVSSLSEQSLVFIASAIILVPIFQKLRFGSVLGYLIAGMIVGPFGLGFIPDSQSVSHLAELGVVILLFMIGLEIQPSKLWSMRKHLFGLGGIQILLTTLVFATFGFGLGFDVASSISLGFALSLSSTAYALQTLNERNEFNTEFGRASFSILLMQDMTAIPMLALIPLITQKTSTNHELSYLSVSFAIASIFVLLISSKYLLRPLFRTIAATRTRELFTAMALFIVLGVSLLMQKLGLSAALGTFVAGVLLADSEYRHEIEINLEPFKGLLMGLFFIAVGMGVSLDLIRKAPLLIIFGAILYLFIKSALIYASGRLFEMQHEKSKRMAITISQGGEFAFVIFGVVSQSQMAPSHLIEALTAIVTLSMAISPAISLLNDELNARACKKQSEPEYDQIGDETPQVIIAGFGRFGQIFGRFFRAQNIPFVAIDHDSSQVELVRRFGSKVYYGDASREDLLISAGAEKAKYFILAIDDIDTSIQTAKLVKEKFPNLTIMARARNRGHAFDLLDLGVSNIKRETFDSAIYFLGDLLIKMGHDEAYVVEMIERFKRHDEIMLIEQYKVRNDDKQFVSLAKQSAVQLAQVLSNDITQSFIDAPFLSDTQNEI